MIVAVFWSKFLRKDPISDEQALAMIITWSQTYGDALAESTLSLFTDPYIPHPMAII